MGAKYWEIRESYGDKMPKVYADPKLQEAYECGYEDAMSEMEEDMGERYGMRENGMSAAGYEDRFGRRESMGGRMGGRMGERRSRDSRGRYM